MARKNYEKLEIIQNHGIDPDRRIIYLTSDIDQECAAQFIKNINYLSAVEGDITVYIMTAGGYWTSGMAIYHAIKQCKNKTIGIAMGDCSSMGSVILQAFDERLAFDDTTFLIHPGTTSADENSFVPNFINQARYEEEILERMYKIYFSRAEKTVNMKFKKFKDYFAVDKYLNSNMALEMGLLDEIKGD